METWRGVQISVWVALPVAVCRARAPENGLDPFHIAPYLITPLSHSPILTGCHQTPSCSTLLSLRHHTQPPPPPPQYPIPNTQYPNYKLIPWGRSFVRCLDNYLTTGDCRHGSRTMMLRGPNSAQIYLPGLDATRINIPPWPQLF